jgi:hypothetical protein
MIILNNNIDYMFSGDTSYVLLWILIKRMCSIIGMIVFLNVFLFKNILK